MRVYEIKQYGVFRGTIADGADDQEINMDGIAHAYDTTFMNEGGSGIVIKLRLEGRAGKGSEFVLSANTSITFNDWDIVAIDVSNKSGTDTWLQIIMGGE